LGRSEAQACTSPADAHVLHVGARDVGDKQPIRRPFGPFLVECVGIDSDEGIGYVAPHLLSKWNVQASDVFAAATENARTYFVDDVASYDPSAPYPLWYVARDDSYESSRLLVPGWLASFSGRVRGRPVAIVPHRGLLVVGGDDDQACLRRLIDSAKAEFEASPRSISPALFTTDAGGKVVPLVLPPVQPLAADVAVGHHMMAMAEYTAQQRQFEERSSGDLFVAPYNAVREKAGGTFSYTTWTKDVPSLLPRAERVALVFDPHRKHGDVLWLPWQILVETVGDCLAAEPDMDPARWRTIRWPSSEITARLRATTIS
jgi:hypothetical protein